MKTFELPDPAGKAGGACTSALLQTLYRDDDDDDIRYTWAETLEHMREKIEGIGLSQQPQLSSSRPIDVNEELHIVPPDCEGTKRALLVGINYVGEPNALTGCHKDTRNVKEFLMNVCGFERENMLILMDDGRHHQPSKQWIEDGLTRLAKISEPGDCIFFQFSGTYDYGSNERERPRVLKKTVMAFRISAVGHGGQMEDKDGDEEDGYDEILIPGDYKESGQIVDDWIYAEFVTKVPAGVHVVAIVDCCHSGTAMDLPYVCNVGEYEIRRDDGFKLPASGVELTPKKKDKEKKKKKTDKKAKKGEKKNTKKKKKNVEEVEREHVEDESEHEDEEEVEIEDADAEEQSSKTKKKKGLFSGFGKKK